MSGSRGTALAFVLVAVLALTLLGHGTLVLALRELEASRAFKHATRAEMAARGALAVGLEQVPRSSDSRVPGPVTPLSTSWTEEGVGLKVGFRWLSSEFFLLEGEGRSRGWGGVRRRGALGWMLDPEARLRAWEGGVELGGDLLLDSGAELVADEVLLLPTGWAPEECNEFDGALGAAFPAGSVPLSAPLPSGGPAAGALARPIPALGLLSGWELLDRARESGTSSSVGVPVGGVSGCPDSGPSLLLASKGDLTLDDTRVCGVLLVEGGFRIEGSGVFQGLALVGGDLSITDSGRFEGMARVSGGVQVQDSGVLRAMGCPVLRALVEIPALREPILLPGASRIPLH